MNKQPQISTEERSISLYIITTEESRIWSAFFLLNEQPAVSSIQFDTLTYSNGEKLFILKPVFTVVCNVEQLTAERYLERKLGLYKYNFKNNLRSNTGEPVVKSFTTHKKKYKTITMIKKNRGKLSLLHTNLRTRLKIKL